MKGFLGFGKKENPQKNLSSIYFELCDCGSEVFVLNYDKDIHMADIAIYESFMSYKFKMSWFQKFRYIYQIVINNKPYADQTILNKNQLIRLRSFLNSILDSEQ